MQHPAAGRWRPACRLHASCMQGVDDALNWHVISGRRFLGVIFCFWLFCIGNIRIYLNFIVILFVSSRFFGRTSSDVRPSSLNLRSTHCNWFCFSVDMPRVWNSFPVELRSNYNSLRAFRNNLKTFVYMYTAGTRRISYRLHCSSNLALYKYNYLFTTTSFFRQLF